MSARHTPGPWKTGGCGEDGWRIILGPATRFYTAYGEKHATEVALVSTSDCSSEDLANARLISAAPELLEALSDCISVMEAELRGLAVIQPELRNAKLAISKATAGGQK